MQFGPHAQETHSLAQQSAPLHDFDVWKSQRAPHSTQTAAADEAYELAQ